MRNYLESVIFTIVYVLTSKAVQAFAKHLCSSPESQTLHDVFYVKEQDF